MKIILCVAVLIAAAAAAPGTWDQTGITLEHTWPHARPTWDDFTKTVDRRFKATANEIFPKSDIERAKEAVNNFKPTPVAHGLIVAAIVFCVGILACHCLCCCIAATCIRRQSSRAPKQTTQLHPAPDEKHTTFAPQL